MLLARLGRPLRTPTRNQIIFYLEFVHLQLIRPKPPTDQLAIVLHVLSTKLLPLRCFRTLFEQPCLKKKLAI